MTLRNMSLSELGAAFPSSTEMFSPSPTPILIPEEPEHSAGIGPSPEEPGGTR